MSGTRLALSPSPILACAILALHVAAATSALLVLDGWPGGVLAVALMALGIAAAWSRALLGAAASVRALELSAAEMRIQLKDGRRFSAAPGGARHVSRWMVALPARTPWRRTVLVTRDMLGAGEFRLLRLWALWGKLPPKVARKQLPA